MEFVLSPAAPADLEALRSIFREAVAGLGPAAYTPGQVAAWQAFADHADFDGFVLGIHTYVATCDGARLGFCGVDDDGHVASLYLRPEACGRGLGARLLRGVLALHPAPASGRHHAETSAFSLPVFLRCGFERVGVEHVERHGERFERTLVARPAPRQARPRTWPHMADR